MNRQRIIYGNKQANKRQRLKLAPSNYKAATCLSSKHGLLTTGSTCSVIAVHANIWTRNLCTVNVFRYCYKRSFKFYSDQTSLDYTRIYRWFVSKKLSQAVPLKNSLPSIFLFSTFLINLKILGSSSLKNCRDSIHHGPSWQVTNLSARQEIFRVVGNETFYFHVHERWPHEPLLKDTNPLLSS